MSRLQISYVQKAKDKLKYLDAGFMQAFEDIKEIKSQLLESLAFDESEYDGLRKNVVELGCSVYFK